MISFVYFDVGGVIIKDFSGTDKWTQMKRDIGIRPEIEREFEQFYDENEEMLHTGKDVDSLIPVIAEKFHINFPPGYSLSVDFVNRFEKNELILPIIEKIKQECRIGLLTNMYPRTLSMIKKKGIMPDIPWDVVVDSSVEGCQKPNLAIFKVGEQKAGVKKENILFIDNKDENVKAAKGFGWQTFLYDPSNHEKSCSDLLNYYNRIRV